MSFNNLSLALRQLRQQRQQEKQQGQGQEKQEQQGQGQEKQEQQGQGQEKQEQQGQGQEKQDTSSEVGETLDFSQPSGQNLTKPQHQDKQGAERRDDKPGVQPEAGATAQRAGASNAAAERETVKALEALEAIVEQIKTDPALLLRKRFDWEERKRAYEEGQRFYEQRPW